MEYKIHLTCRLCDSPHLVEIINLGDQMIQHAFIQKDKSSPSLSKYPTKLMRCTNKACGLVQLKHSIDPKILYEVYWYRSNTNNTMKNHLQQLMNEALQKSVITNPKLLDIGCNDGTMLDFAPKTCKKTGIDPSDIAEEVDDSIELIQDFFPSKKIGQRTFDIITSIAMFYDVDNPVKFAKEIKKILAVKGLWILEVAYLPTTIQNTSYDTICHEHLTYYHLGALDQIAKQAGLKIVKAGLNSINGGSIRCYLTHVDSIIYDDISSDIEMIRNEENNIMRNKKDYYQSFTKKVKRHKKELFDLIQKLKNDGKTIHIYGASTKGNTILQYCGIDNKLIDVAADKNEEKWGARTPGSNIPIISEKTSRDMRPDYYLVLPWSFKDEFLKREQKLRDMGVKMIFPLPEILIV
ncbi:MAG: class I SAM-dependent methyltransferase [bacterium]|nr:class I SAM-dependent methyltransferase [bacterium]